MQLYKDLLVILLCLFPVPGQPIIFLVGKSFNSLKITWNATDCINYTVEWEKTGCLAENQENNGSITTNDTSYIITGLEEGSRYNIIVTAGGLSNSVSAVTTLRGYSELHCQSFYNRQKCVFLFYSSICCSKCDSDFCDFLLHHYPLGVGAL